MLRLDWRGKLETQEPSTRRKPPFHRGKDKEYELPSNRWSPTDRPDQVLPCNTQVFTPQKSVQRTALMAFTGPTKVDCRILPSLVQFGMAGLKPQKWKSY